jgi:hypothetical protein
VTIRLGDAVGAYGAAVATGMALLRWFEFRRDRQSVRLTGRIVAHPSHKSEEPPWVIVTVTNVGRRAVQLRDLGVVRTRRGRILIGSDIGVHPRLNEGQEVGVTPRPEALFGEHVGVRTVYVEDTHGRAWEMPKRAFRRLREEYRAAVAAAEEAGKQREISERRKWLGEVAREAGKDKQDGK